MSTNLILPTNFKPSHYNVRLNDIDTNKNVFSGNVAIELETIESSNTACVNIRDITVDKVWITKADNSIVDVSSKTHDSVNEVLSLQFPEKLTGVFTMHLDYQGMIQSNMSGFYRSDYKDAATGEEKFTLSTQFEATEARRAFPCFDEPELKATFDITITAKKEFTVLSNMPLDTETAAENGDKTYTFHTTPLMSTYLVAWAIGEYEYIETETEKKIYPTLDGYSKVGSSNTKGSLPIRVYTAKGKSNQGKFAISVAKRVVDYFSELFEIPYPLPKLDLLCVESYSHNAMENFSLITFRPTALLLTEDDENSLNSEAAKKVAYVVSHEIAHQWFGNLVTMKWWDELWLNEGFATWVGYHAVSKLFPEWDVPSMVLLHSHEVALGLDSLTSSHPVKVTIRDPKDIDQVFDSISYLKGCSILEMISGYLGESTFLKGVALYLNQNKFKNATMEDLFSCIGEVASLNILNRIKPWILDIGYPMITVNQESGSNKLQLSQDRFLLSKDNANDVGNTKWWIPLMITQGDKLRKDLEFDSKNTEIEAKSQFNFLNTDGFAFYRTKYESKAMLNEIFNNLEKLSSRSKMSLISDIATADTLGNFLELISKIAKLQDSKDVYVWKMICSYLFMIRSLIYDDCEKELLDKLDSFALSLLEPMIDAALEYLIDPRKLLDDKSDQYRLLRAESYDTILESAGELSHPKVVATASRLFNDGKVDASNRQLILRTVLGQPDTSLETFNTVANRLDTIVLDELETTLSCLGDVQNPILFTPCLNLLFKIEPMNVQFLATAWGKNPYIHKSILDYMKVHHIELFERLKVNATVISRFVSFTFKQFTGADSMTQLQEFFKGQDISAYDRSVKQTLEMMAYNTAYSKKNIPSIRKFFE